MASPQISAQEQLVLELINRARLDPAGEAARFGISLNQGLPAGTLTATPKQPLAWDGALAKAAALHSESMVKFDYFDHTGIGGTQPDDRMISAGYGPRNGFWWGENIASEYTTGTISPTGSALSHHKGLFLSPGHRENILGENFREIGLGQEFGPYSIEGDTYNASLLTQNFGAIGTVHFITGVAYTDRDGDKFYDVGEGRSGVIFDWLGNSGGAIASGGTGGYAVTLPTKQTGMHDVNVTAGTTTMRVSLDLSGGNVKLDLVGTTLASSADMVLEIGARGRLLGAAHLDLAGNVGGNTLEGNKGNNTLNGHGGTDSLFGSSGQDRLLGGDGGDRLEGGTGSDRLWGQGGNDRFVFKDELRSTTGSDRIEDLRVGDLVQIDLAGTLPVESLWEKTHVFAATGGWRIAMDDGASIFVAGTLSRAQIEAAVDIF